MTFVEVHLFNRLIGFPGVASLVGSRIFPLKMAPDTKLPAITYQRISGERVLSMDKDSGLAHPRIQFDAWGNSYAEVKKLAEQVRLALEGYRDMTSTVMINGVIYLGDTDLYSEAESTEIYRVSMDFEVWHNEAEPT